MFTIACCILIMYVYTVVIGLGNVDQVASIQDPHLVLQELTCRYTPGPRAWHTALAYEERLYVMGGKNGSTNFYGDTWYRDAVFPVARMLEAPLTNTGMFVYRLLRFDFVIIMCVLDQAWFHFSSNKPGCVFEMRVWDPINYIEIRPWRSVAKRQYVGFLQWQLGGPGNGIYTVYARAIDAAGNKDYLYVPKVNVHQWYYLSPIPWTIIGTC